MKTSEQINELAKALSVFQGLVPSIPKNKTVTQVNQKTGRSHSYKYADLDSIWEAIRKPLSSAELSVVQTMTSSSNGFVMETNVMHSSGQWSLTECPIVEPKEYGFVPMQTLGGLITYGRRYGLSAALGITTEDDLDANQYGIIEDKKQLAKTKINIPIQEMQTAKLETEKQFSPEEIKKQQVGSYKRQSGTKKGKALMDLKPSENNSFLDWCNKQIEKGEALHDSVVSDMNQTAHWVKLNL